MLGNIIIGLKKSFFILVSTKPRQSLISLQHLSGLHVRSKKTDLSIFKKTPVFFFTFLQSFFQLHLLCDIFIYGKQKTVFSLINPVFPPTDQSLIFILENRMMLCLTRPPNFLKNLK